MTMHYDLDRTATTGLYGFRDPRSGYFADGYRNPNIGAYAADARNPYAQPSFGARYDATLRGSGYVDPGVGADTPLAMHIARGALPAHESGLDCRIRIITEGPWVAGVCRCDTAHGPVVLCVKAHVGTFMGNALLAARGVREELLHRAAALPTEPQSTYVTKANALRNALGLNDPVAIAKLAMVKQAAAAGDRKASAFLALVVSQDPARGAPVFGAARAATMPTYHRAAVSIPGLKPNLTSAQHARIAQVLKSAVAHIPAFRKSKAARR